MKAAHADILRCISGFESNAVVSDLSGKVWECSLPLSLIWSRRVGSSILQVNRGGMGFASLEAVSTCFIGCVLCLGESTAYSGTFRAW